MWVNTIRLFMLDRLNIIKNELVGLQEKTNGRVIVNIILEKESEDRDKFDELKRYMGITKPNTEIIRSCIRTTHKLLFG